MRRRVILPALMGLVLLVPAGWWFWQRGSSLSADQQNTVRFFGQPAQFVITYLPRKDGQQLVRSEVWYYPTLGKQISYLGGKLAVVDTYTDDSKLPATNLKPDDFDFGQEYADLEKILGKENIDPVDYLESFWDDSHQTYFSDKAVFIMENGHLIYLQTVGVSDLPQPTLEPPTPTPEVTPSVAPIP